MSGQLFLLGCEDTAFFILGVRVLFLFSDGFSFLVLELQVDIYLCVFTIQGLGIMSCVEGIHKPAGLINGAHTLLEDIRLLKEMQDHPGLFISVVTF